ncbi:hypothetical protein ATANTOWER_015814 [Ataeniobius toweri]|uniref:Uncharacterized protein n=1 Tax=Ataeniobius toweri TaxID=208326 RepID=A0ABU7BWW3_9TELE|nr:hypothetical protein [Ataeniobius toweri]
MPSVSDDLAEIICGARPRPCERRVHHRTTQRHTGQATRFVLEATLSTTLFVTSSIPVDSTFCSCFSFMFRPEGMSCMNQCGVWGLRVVLRISLFMLHE